MGDYLREQYGHQAPDDGGGLLFSPAFWICVIAGAIVWALAIYGVAQLLS